MDPSTNSLYACGSNANRFILNKTHTLLISSIFSNQWPPISSAVTHHVQSVLKNTEHIMSYNLWLKHYSLDVRLMNQCSALVQTKTYLIPGVNLGGLVRIKSRIWFI